MQIKIFRKAKVYSPEFMGEMDILVAGGEIAAIEEDLGAWESIDEVESVDCRGLIAAPGLIDGHVHISGGGGEGGFSTRTPEIEAHELFSSGVTTVVGCLGTDGTCRSPEALIAKAKALREEGLSVHTYTGSYEVPVKTITGSVGRDIMLVEEVIGVGEIAISDHRSSQPSAQELAKIASEAHVAGMLSGKAGIVNIHIGDGKDGLNRIFEIIENTDIPKGLFYPTHVNRNEAVFSQAVEYGRGGGFIDMTSSTSDYFIEQGEIPCAKGLSRMLERGVPLECITFTSDGQGSLPAFDEEGCLIGMEIGKPSSLLKSIVAAVIEEDIPFGKAIRVATSNTARILKLKGKGELEVGNRADILFLNEEDYSIQMVLAGGRTVLSNISKAGEVSGK